MSEISNAFSTPAWGSVPENILLLNNRVMDVKTVKVNENTFPNQGMFAHLFKKGVLVSIEANGIQLKQDGNLKIDLKSKDLKRLVIFLDKSYAQNQLPTNGPRYRTVINIQTKADNYYWRVFGVHAGKYLVDHPNVVAGRHKRNRMIMILF